MSACHRRFAIGPGVDRQRILSVFAKDGLRIILGPSWAGTSRSAECRNAGTGFILNPEKRIHGRWCRQTALVT